MANNKWSGYAPKKETTIPNEGAPGSGTHLDRVNPFEFRKGMDIELTSLGVSRLAESTPEEREKCTEIVLKNLIEHDGYYTALITYETEHRNVEKKPSFKQWLAEQGETQMKEVTQEFKNDKMTELKEAIKSEIKNILSEFDAKAIKQMNKDTAKQDKEPSKKDMKGVSKDSAVQIRKKIDGAKKELAKAEKERSKHFATYKKAKAKAKNDDQAADAMEDYKTAVKSHQNVIDTKKAEIKKLTDSLTDLSEERKQLRREVAKMMMDKDTHMEILKIVKEGGVTMNEGSAGVKMYYEIAKTAYQEGFMAALDKNQD